VGEPRRADDVADGVDSGKARLVALVGLQETFEQVELQVRAQQSLEARLHSHGHQHLLEAVSAFRRASLEGGGGAVLANLDAGDASACQHLDAVALELAPQQLGAVVVFDGKDARSELDQRHLSSEGVVEVGEFHPDGPGPDDQDGLGTFGES